MRCGSAFIVTLMSLLLTAGCASSETAVEPAERPATPVPTATAPPAPTPEEVALDPIDNMEEARTVPAAVMLEDGRLLIAGGANGNLIYSSTEVYDPATGSWASAGQMGEPRAYFHTATLLANGAVLVTGGVKDQTFAVLDTAELYDPAAGTWAPIGSMAHARQFHTATLLEDGRVLVTGGRSGPRTVLASAEIYDPATGAWTPTGGMLLRRDSHTATLLEDGRVLVVGGRSDVKLLSSTEIYDPATGRWMPAGGMEAGKDFHTATLLSDGRVLAAGGRGDNAADETDRMHDHAVATAEVYDPATDRWSPTGDMNSSRSTHTAVLLADGTVLAVGGGNNKQHTLASAEVYDPDAGMWSLVSDMDDGRQFHAMALLDNGHVIVVGGANGAFVTIASVTEYDPVTDRWSPSGPTY